MVDTPGIKDNPAQSLAELSEFASRNNLESPEMYRTTLNAVLDVLSKEDGIIHLQDIPTIIIPDIHARRGLLIDIFRYQLEEGPYAGRRVFELMQQGLVNVCSVGDMMHSEERSDWVINDNGDWTAELLDREMVRSLGVATMVMYLKVQYPEHFHCLRGNHDDIAGELTNDFRKFVGLKVENDTFVLVDGRPVLTADKGESRIVRDWVLEREGWGQTFLALWGQFDKALPVFAEGPYYVVSHTLPHRTLSEAEIRDKNRSRDTTFELTSRRGEHRKVMDETLENLGIRGTVKHWFYGHSQVPPTTNGGKYDESADGLTVRLNNPKNYVFAYIPASFNGRPFDPAKDVYIKTPTEETFHR